MDQKKPEADMAKEKWGGVSLSERYLERKWNYPLLILVKLLYTFLISSRLIFPFWSFQLHYWHELVWNGREKRRVGFVKLSKWFVTVDNHNDSLRSQNYITHETSIFISLIFYNLKLSHIISRRILCVCIIYGILVWNSCTYMFIRLTFL